MPKKPWSHSADGKQNSSSPLRKPSPGSAGLTLLVTLVLALFSSAPALALALADQPVSVRLSVAFDLAASTMNATATIDLPADTPASLSLAGLSVSAMEMDGKPLAADRDNPTTVTIGPAATARKISITYKKTTPPGPMGDGDNRIAADGITLTGQWHPRLLGGDCRFELSALVPDDFTAIAEADQVEEHDSPKGRRFLFRFSQPVAAIHLVAGPYELTTTPFGDGRELNTYFFPEDRELVARYRDQTLEYLARYQKLLGDFPYRHFAVVENRLPTGYAMPTFTLLGQAVVRLPFITATSLGHEVLHQWFGNGIQVNYAGGNWCEGLVTYLADQTFAAEKGEGVEFRKEQLVKYQSYVPANNSFALKDFMDSDGGTTDRDRQHRRAVGYNKASMLFHMLRLQVGDGPFFAGLRDFYQRLRYRPAGWDDLETSFETAAHQELGPFFRQWLDRADLPALTIDAPRNAENDGQPELRFTLTQHTATPYHLTVPVTVTSEGGTIRKDIEVTDKQTEVAIPLTAPAEKVVVDANYDLMRRLEPEEQPPVWSRFIGAAKRLAVVANQAAAERFKPLTDTLAADGCTVKEAGAVTDSDVAGASVLLLGASTVSRSLFAQPAHPAEGFTVDVRANPLNRQEVAVLVSAADQAQVAAAAAKLRHYGKYGFLHFIDGRMESKRIPTSDQGLQATVDEPPQAVITADTTSFATIIDRLLPAQVVYVGEGHTSYEDHLLQLRVIRALYSRDPDLAIGMEMFNRSAQPALDDYIAQRIDEATMLRRTHYFENWGYDYRLYQDIIRFARRHHLPIVALNQEKAIVSKVFKDGTTASLSAEEREQLPPDRDLDMPGYRDRIRSVFNMHSAPSPERFKGFFQAQALWDETMAATIAATLSAHPGQHMVVLAGVGHVAKANAIPPRVVRRLPGVKQAVVANIAATDADPERVDYAFFLAPAQLPPAPIMGVVLADTDQGIKVEELSPHGRAKDVGVRPDDLILALDGEPVKTVADLKVFMVAKKKGDTVRVTIKRPRTILPDEELVKEIPL